MEKFFNTFFGSGRRVFMSLIILFIFLVVFNHLLIGFISIASIKKDKKDSSTKEKKEIKQEDI